MTQILLFAKWTMLSFGTDFNATMHILHLEITL